ncbi:MAG: serine phosphatase RsbU (regulator of sigma subunit)/anti-sigma regulatory factor (Ser/Thr protein kinase) [Verrucomicrobiales bacterium]
MEPLAWKINRMNALANSGLDEQASASELIFRHRIPASLSEVANLRDVFMVFLNDACVSGKDRSVWGLVFSEALSNAIRHGCQLDALLSVSVEWWVLNGEVHLAITDPGNGPPIESTETPTLPEDPLQEGGRGLFLIHEFADLHEHWRSPLGYRQVIRRRHAGLSNPVPEDSELTAVLEELSTAYECLSAFHRFGTAMIGAGRPSEFMGKGLEILSVLYSPSPDLVRVCLSENVLSGIKESLKDQDEVVTFNEAPIKAQAVLQNGRSFYWEHASEVADDALLAPYGCGCCFPIVANGQTLGCLLFGLIGEEGDRLSRQLSNLRTFTDLLGIALANANLQVVRDEEQRATRELEIAAEIQRNLLSVHHTPRSDAWSLSLKHRTARDVGGDHLEAIYDASGNLILTVIDVMGKGVSAAMLAAIFRTALHLNLDKAVPLAAIVESINRVLCSQLENMTMFITCAMARISADLKTIEVVNAGHCPVMLLDRSDAVRELEPGGPPLGLFPATKYESESFDLKDDDAVLIVTDGLYEWQDDGKWWGWDNLKETAAIHAYDDPEEFWNRMQIRIRESEGDGQPADDQTMLFWKRNFDSKHTNDTTL